MKKILFVCGTGGITSTIAEQNVQKYLKDNGVDVQTIRSSPTEIESYLDGIDLIVSTTYISENYSKPVINAISLLTGIGKEDTLKKIYDKVMELDKGDSE